METITEDLSSSKPSQNAIQINAFLENTPDNTIMLLTTRMKYNRPSGVRHIQLGGLDMAEGKELFMRMAGDNERLNEEKTQNAIHNLARKKRRSPSFAYNFS